MTSRRYTFALHTRVLTGPQYASLYEALQVAFSLQEPTVTPYDILIERTIITSSLNLDKICTLCLMNVTCILHRDSVRGLLLLVLYQCHVHVQGLVHMKLTSMGFSCIADFLLPRTNNSIPFRSIQPARNPLDKFVRR